MSSPAKMLSVLDLLDAETSRITPSQVQESLNLTRATAYRYLKTLTDAGLLARFGGFYVLGPRAIEMDYLIRHNDPLVQASERILASVSAAHDCDLQLIGLSGNHILVTSHVRCDRGVPVSYGRGRTMPVQRGAGGRMILAMLPPQRQRAVVAGALGLAAAKLDPTEWAQQRETLTATRRQGFTISQGELDPGNVGVAVPILHEALGDPAALVMIMPQKRFALADESRIVDLLRNTATQIVAALDGAATDPAPPPAPRSPLGKRLIGLDPDLAGATEAQRKVVDMILSGPRGTLASPFLAMLDSPPLTAVIQEVGATIRYRSTLSDALREIAILATAGAVPCGYEWNYHAPIARAAGVTETIIDATRPGARGATISGSEGIIITLCREIIAQAIASPETLATAVDEIGRTGATEAIAIAGYYALLANFIRSAGYDQAFE